MQSDLLVKPFAEKPTAIFWDIENIDVKGPKGVQRLIDSIRRDLINFKQLSEVKFTCVFAKGTIGDEKNFVLVDNSIDIERVEKGGDAADLKLIEFIDEFVSIYKDKSVIVLITGDGDFIKRLVKHKDEHKITVYTVHREDSFSCLLDAIADETYRITPNGLVSITDRMNVVAVKITGIPDNLDENMVRATLGETFGYVGGSREAIYFDCDRNCYWINFECEEVAGLVVKTKNNLKLFNGIKIVIEYDKNPPEDVVKRLSELDAEKSVRKRKMNIIRTAIDYEYEQSWKEAKKSILSFKEDDMIKCVLVSGFPGRFDLAAIEIYFKNQLNISVRIIWQNNNSVAFLKDDDDHELIKIIESFNRSTVQTKLKATLFSIPRKLPEKMPEIMNKILWDVLVFWWPVLITLMNLERKEENKDSTLSKADHN